MPPKISAEYVPYSQVSPEGPRNVTEHVSINFPSVQFHNSVGEALKQVGEQGYGTLSRATREVGAAFDNLGQAFTGTGERLWHRAIGLQDVQNQTTQTQAEMEWTKYVNTKQVEYHKLQGEAASEETLKAFLKDIDDKHVQMVNKLPNEAVQRGFFNSTASSIGRAGMAAATHAATETRKSYIASSEARVDQLSDEGSKQTDIAATKEITTKIHDEIYGKQAPAKGWTIDVANQAFKKALTELYSSQAKVMSRTDPVGAIKLLETNKDFIGQPKYDEAMEHVLSNQRVIVSTNIGNEVHDSNPDAPREEKAAEARKKARAISKDPRLEEAAVREVERKDQEHRTDVRQQEERDKISVDQELFGFGNKEGKIPTKVQDLYVNPATRAALERIESKNPKEYNRIIQQLARNAKGDYPDTYEARTRQWELQGMAINYPGQFRDLDLLAEQIPMSMRSQLREVQLRLIKEGIKLESDPQTSKALQILRGNGVLPKDLTPLHKDKWNLFTGMMREALVAEGKKRGFDKPLSNDETINLGKTLLDKMPGTGYWPSKLDWSQQQFYQTLKEIPDDHLNAMRQRYPGRTDDEILRNYRQSMIRLEYDKRYSTEGTKEKPQAPTVQAKTPPEQPPIPPPEEQQGPPKPAEKRSEMLGRKAMEFRSKIISEGARKREEEAAAKRQGQ